MSNNLRNDTLSNGFKPRYIRFVLWSLVAFGVTLLLVACERTEVEYQPECELESLLISLDDLPDGTMISTIPQIDPDSTVNSRVVNFFVDDSVSIGQSVFWYPEEEHAIRKYNEEKVSGTGVDIVGRVFVIPKNVDLSGLQADKYDLGCAQLINGYRCIFTARYKTYVTRLNSNIDLNKQVISFERFTQIVFRIDEIFGDCALK